MLSSTVFRMFICRKLDYGERWHVDQYTIDCNSGEHKFFIYLAIFMAFVYPFGVPFFFFVPFSFNNDFNRVFSSISKLIRVYHMTLIEFCYPGRDVDLVGQVSMFRQRKHLAGEEETQYNNCHTQTDSDITRFNMHEHTTYKALGRVRNTLAKEREHSAELRRRLHLYGVPSKLTFQREESLVPGPVAVTLMSKVAPGLELEPNLKEADAEAGSGLGSEPESYLEPEPEPESILTPRAQQAHLLITENLQLTPLAQRAQTTSNNVCPEPERQPNLEPEPEPKPEPEFAPEFAPEIPFFKFGDYAGE